MRGIFQVLEFQYFLQFFVNLFQLPCKYSPYLGLLSLSLVWAFRLIVD